MEIYIRSNTISIPSLEISYAQNTTISVAANMREMMKAYADKIDNKEKAVVFVDTPALTVPEEQLSEENAKELYKFSITATDEDTIIVQKPVEGLKVVALYAVSKDLNTVIADNFKEHEFLQVGVEAMTAASPSKREMSNGSSKTLFAYFYDTTMYAYAFKQGRLNFFNSYEAANAQDCAYILLSVWKQLGYNQLKDELVLHGEVIEKKEMKTLLEEFIKGVRCE